MSKYVVYSHQETEFDWEYSGIPLYWNNNDGWVGLESATVFEEHELPETTFFAKITRGSSVVKLPE